MSDAYEDDLAGEQAIYERVAAAEIAETAAAQKNAGGRPYKADPIKVVAWRQAHGATISATADQWKISVATVKRWCRDYADAAKLERKRWECERLDREAQRHEHDLWQMFNRQLARYISLVELTWHSKCAQTKGTPLETATVAAMETARADAERGFREDWERSMGPIPAYPFW